MKTVFKVLIIVLLFILLAAVRFFENEMFYDPLIAFYHGDFKLKPPPVLDEWRLILNTGFRYWLNTLVSLMILFVAFRKWNIVKFSLFIYVLAFVVLLVPFVWLVFNMEPDNYFTLFYVRRFLIQPLFILLLLPAFYYQNFFTRPEKNEADNRG